MKVRNKRNLWLRNVRRLLIGAAALLLAFPAVGSNSMAEEVQKEFAGLKLPFKADPTSFRTYLGKNGYKVLGLENCQSIFFPAYGSVPSMLYYHCGKAFLELKDPRGTQRCQGKIWYTSRSDAINGVYSEIAKNDCRWIGN